MEKSTSAPLKTGALFVSFDEIFGALGGALKFRKAMPIILLKGSICPNAR